MNTRRLHTSNQARTCSPPCSPQTPLEACSSQRADPDLYASSVSSADLSPLPPTSRPPRPDSPRPLLSDRRAVTQARLHQLEVWGNAAETERESGEHDETALPNSQPLTVADLTNAVVTPFEDMAQASPSSSTGSSTPSRSDSADMFAGDRRPDRPYGGLEGGVPIARRKSFFCPRPTEGLVRRPSLWIGRQGRDGMADAAGDSKVATFYSQYGLGRMSRRRPQSFHRYHRVTQDGHGASMKSGRGGRTCEEFDDLVDGLHATKVTESLQPPVL